MEQLVDAEDVRVRRFFQSLQLAHHKVLKYLEFVHFLLRDKFDGAFDTGVPMLADAHLPKTALTEHSPNPVPVFDIRNLFKPLKIFKIEHMPVLLFHRKKAVLGGAARIVNAKRMVGVHLGVRRHLDLICSRRGVELVTLARLCHGSPVSIGDSAARWILRVDLRLREVRWRGNCGLPTSVVCEQGFLASHTPIHIPRPSFIPLRSALFQILPEIYHISSVQITHRMALLLVVALGFVGAGPVHHADLEGLLVGCDGLGRVFAAVQFIKRGPITLGLLGVAQATEIGSHWGGGGICGLFSYYFL